ncbi:lipase [Prauserella coralliicola]|nr:lipase [Prauserella coralliicola]
MSRTMGSLTIALAIGVAVAMTGGTGSAAQPYAGFAPVDQPGPALSVEPELLAASLRCTANVENATREPVLLLPATTVTSEQNFGFNYEPLFRRLGIPYCASDSPQDPQNMGDMQVRAQYVTYAIRTVHAMAGRKIAILGHSQGGMIMRWSLRFWPDTRPMVADVIGMAATNHGAGPVVDALCALGCSAALQQQRAGSAFMKALNSGQETFPGIDYTQIYTRVDEFVQPNLDDHGTSSVHGGGGTISNVAVQDICPLDVSEHLLIGTLDPVAKALVLDALNHPGPADPDRIDRSVCSQLSPPITDLIPSATGFVHAGGQVAFQLTLGPKDREEPRLECYVTATCARTSQPDR